MVIKSKVRESVNFRLDPKLLKAARKKAEKEGTSLTALVVAGLNHVLGINSSTDKNLEMQERLDDLTTRLQDLEERVKHINKRSRN